MTLGKFPIFVGPEYEDLEVWYPELRLEEAGYETVLAGIGDSSYHGKHGYPCRVDAHVRDVLASSVVGTAGSRRMGAGQDPPRRRRPPTRA